MIKKQTINSFQQNLNKTSSMSKLTNKQKQNYESPAKRVFTRKPSNAMTTFGRKKKQSQLNQVQNKNESSMISQLLQKSKNEKFVCSKSQIALNNSSKKFISDSSSSQINSKQQIQQDLISGCQLSQQSKIPPKTNSKQTCCRKTIGNANDGKKFINRRNYIQRKTSLSKIPSRQKRDKPLIQQSINYRTPQPNKRQQQESQLIRTKNTDLKQFEIEQNISNSNTHISFKLKTIAPPICCTQCAKYQSKLEQSNMKLNKLTKTIGKKDKQIQMYNNNISQLQKKNKAIQRKYKELQKQNYPSKISFLEEQLVSSQEECQKLKDHYTKSIQDLKYKNVQNSTLKKYQDQCVSLQRKCQMLSSQRNELRQKLTNVTMPVPSSYIHYPSPSRKKSKAKDVEIKTSRDQVSDFYDADQTLSSTTQGFKKKTTIKYCDQSEESLHISLSTESNF